MSLPSIFFHVSFIEPQAHYAEITMRIKGLQKPFIDVKMPVWAPGSYLIREYAKNIERFQVYTSSEELIPHEKISKNTWRIYSDNSDIRIRYSVYGFENSVRTNFIDDSHAFLSPVGTFMYVDDCLDYPVQVQIEMPDFWSKISTGLEKSIGLVNTYKAPNFDILFDSPIEIGNQDTWSFDIEGTLHECAMVGGGTYDKHRLTQDIRTIVAEENRIWGSNPNAYYLFITHNYQNSSGGLEHLNSTVLATSRFSYTQETTYKSYLSLIAHEYFHLWNVKRLRPKALGPFDYEAENYTTGLWIMEGFTSYYDNLIIRRCSFYDEKEYLQMLAVDFNTVYNRPGYEIQSAALASHDTWIKQYRPDENSHNTSISYYNKGAMLAAALDLKILAETGGQQRLDDVLKRAYQKFYLIENRGFEEHELMELIHQTTNVDVSEIFQAAHSLEELEYNLYFNKVGYEIVDLNTGLQPLSMGIKTINNDTRIIVKNVDRDSGAWKGGINVDDEIIAANGYRVDPTGRTIDYILTNSKEGDRVSLIVARDGLIKNLNIQLQYSNKKSLIVQRKENATAEERRLGNIWIALDQK
ncbi:M61 family metallopeptidase [Sphingobacterium olei]|uniref:M61 family metallopeptidase n=1 Tax=Sphingobacterium olei TaxID=2571155 RepID=A0A4V6WHM4_9SPHI|nr:PDZ domain-containing protein [Sphingobacterium olei]TJZ52468.1 M61 family metallopeptidase [Sphingobacterium olei]